MVYDKRDVTLRRMIESIKRQMPPNPSQEVIEAWGEQLAFEFMLYSRYEEVLGILVKSGKIKLTQSGQYIR